MPRVGRVVLPDYPHHIVQRGHNRHVVFAADSDFGYYLETLSQWRGVYGVREYAWCLITNPIHLVVEPPEETALLGPAHETAFGPANALCEPIRKKERNALGESL